MLQRWIKAIRANRRAAIAAAVVAVLALVASVVIGLPPLFMVGLLVAFWLVTWGIYRWRSRHLDPRLTTAPGRTLVSSALAVLVVVFLAAQAVPYGRDHSNPAITGEPDWATPQTRQLVKRACFDCHSNEVT